MAAEDPFARRLGLVVSILQRTGEVNGRTRLQKLTYLVNLLWNCFDDFGFHYYGPFSQDLVWEVELLRDNGFVQEETRTTGNARVMYRYRLSPEAVERAETVVRNISSQQLRVATDALVDELESYSSDNLEIMASLVYLRFSNPAEDDGALVRDLRELKPYFSAEEIRGGLRIFGILRNHGVNVPRA